MQIDIKDIQVFQDTIKSLNDLQSRAKTTSDLIINELAKKETEVNRELSISNGFLNAAKAHEMQKAAVLAQKTAELEKALQQEAAAIASGFPPAIAAATAYVAQKTHEEVIAQREYQKARQNRVNMEKRVELVRKAKYNIETLYEHAKIQLNSANTKIGMLTQVAQVRLSKGDLVQKNYLAQDTDINGDGLEYKNIPQSGGKWSGEPGNSKWIPDRDSIPKQPYGNKKSWGEILDKYSIDGIEFKDGEPDFTPIAEASVEIEDFTTQRDSNFRQADELLAQEWNRQKKDGKSDWTAEDVKNYRKKKKITWHERSDMKTLDLVPQDIHANIPHSGGISKKKKLEMEVDDD